MHSLPPSHGASRRLSSIVARGLALLGIVGVIACASPRTQVIVVVETDIAVPVPLAIVRASTGATSHDFALAGPLDLPFSFGISPGPGGPSGPIDLVVDGRGSDGAVIVSRSVRTGFTAGQTTLLRVRLEAACVGMTMCPMGTTCIDGRCVDDTIRPDLLIVIQPGLELRDAGAGDGGLDAPREDAPLPDVPGADVPRLDVPRLDVPGLDVPGLDVPGLDVPGLDAPMLDAPMRDGGALDVPAIDAPGADGGTDVGPTGPPRSCAAVRDAGGPSGVYEIDPDGPGGAAPFSVYCENTADGGGWTLIARVAEVSTRLRYDDPAWTGSIASAFGDPATLTTGEAILPSYWTLPVSELRMGMTDTAGTRWATATLTRTTTLRDAMDIPGAVRIEGIDMPAWNRLANDTFTSVCTTAGLGMSMVNARVRIGVLVAGAAPCGSTATAYAWVGFGAANDTWSGCSRYDTTSGGSQPCGGPPSFRFTHPAYGVVMAR